MRCLNLNFEVFGREGDVRDRRSTAFAKHNLLIGSINTLTLKERMQRLEEVPDWDLIVFDEAHHLTAYQAGRKVKKTLNYKLAELLRKKSPDLLLHSATLHQGDHFRFWMMVQPLDRSIWGNSIGKPRSEPTIRTNFREFPWPELFIFS